jgi:hypothetical protein
MSAAAMTCAARFTASPDLMYKEEDNRLRRPAR